MRSSLRIRAWLVVVALLHGCDSKVPPGPSPPGSMAGPAVARPSGTFLDERIAACPTAAEVASVRDVRLGLDAVAAARPLVCRAADGSADLTYHARNVVQALILMKELEFDAPLPWTPATLWAWFRELGVGINIFMDDRNSACCGPDRMIRYSVPTRTEEPPRLGVDALSTISLLIHEARHIEVGRHPCQDRYDNLVSDLGAFGVQYYFLDFLARHSNPAQVPAAYRDYHLYRACALRGSVFCRESGACETPGSGLTGMAIDARAIASR